MEHADGYCRLFPIDEVERYLARQIHVLSRLNEYHEKCTERPILPSPGSRLSGLKLGPKT